MKKITGIIKLQILAGKATPVPPIGPALGQKGVNISAFCKEFNNATRDQSSDSKLPVIVTVYSDRSFSFVVKSPTTANLIKKYSGLKKGSSTPGILNHGEIKKEDLLKIANIKFIDMGLDSIGHAVKVVEGTARSIGVNVIN